MSRSIYAAGLRWAGAGVMIVTAAATSSAQTSPPWRAQTSPVSVELRGLSVVSNRVAWASGASGTVLRTIDGEAWTVIPVPGAEDLDFRDIQAWDENTAIAMSIGPGPASSLYKTTDGGASWKKVFTNRYPTGFWDAIAFWDKKRGALFGDPVDGHFQVYLTGDGGETWTSAPASGMPPALEGEGAFAASGSCLATGPDKRLAFVTGGGVESRVFTSKDGGETFHVSVSPISAAAPPKGLFSIAWIDSKQLVVVGGNYKERVQEGINAAFSGDGGGRWTGVTANPIGFLSSVVRGPSKDAALVAVGLAGTGISNDGGKTWTALDTAGYNTAGFAPPDGSKPSSGWAVGPKGVIARWQR